jgi:hypothetical protein
LNRAAGLAQAREMKMNQVADRQEGLTLSDEIIRVVKKPQQISPNASFAD